MKRLSACAALWVLVMAVVLVCPLFAAEQYYHVTLDELRLTEGTIPQRSNLPVPSWSFARLQRDMMQPYAVLDGAGEVYVLDRVNNGWFPQNQNRNLMGETVLAVKTDSAETIAGRLFVPNGDWSAMVRLRFEIPATSSDQKAARTEFLEAKKRHYKRLLDMNVPGGAWFRHQMNEADYQLSTKSDDTLTSVALARLENANRNRGDGELMRTYGLFSGGRAISENLSLDDILMTDKSTKRTIDIETIKGVTVEEIDWTESVADLDPERDPLASVIPHDQHAIIFPTFKDLLDTLDESDARGTPILRLMEPRAESAKTRDRYDAQLCLETTMIARIMGPKVIASVAFTGSDPYLRAGSDVAVLFEAKSTTPLVTHLKKRQKDSGVIPEMGEMEGVPYTFVVTPDRDVSSYLAVLDNIVVVTNSTAQLKRVINTWQEKIPSLGSLPEYTYYRARYPVGENEESAFILLSDATIRRWCDPRWRIGASRRIRAQAELGELQARHLNDLVTGVSEPRVIETPESWSDLGTVTLTKFGVVSSVYGSLEFQTPIIELDLDKVTEQELWAYDRFRERYERRWRRFFDPIAIRLTIKPDELNGDMSVRPLTSWTEYREWRGITGTAEIPSGAGDPHPQALLHFIMALDPQSEPVRAANGMAASMAPTIGDSALNWIGQWFAVYADDDPLWDQLAEVADDRRAREDFFEQHVWQLPVGLVVDVQNAFKLTAFLAAFRTYIDQSAPGMTIWETRTHGEKPYVRIAPSADAQTNMPEEAQDVALYYAARPSYLLFTLNEDLLKRSLEREAEKSKAADKGDGGKTNGEWLGKSTAAHVTHEAVGMLRALYRDPVLEQQQRLAWGNLFILNEWRRQFEVENPLAFHEQYWKTKLLCPAGGQYVWNEEFQTYESTALGFAGSIEDAAPAIDPLKEVRALQFGLTFEDDGLRARVRIERENQ